ncbi:MAG: hypothetical protein QOK81_05010, partial [Nitrososphaeraceae archaeon]|nr:hypothetical protein [Nitrososphaeraceae archaeon]
MFSSRGGGIKPGQYVFLVQKDGKHNKIIIGRIRSVNGSKVQVAGTYVRPTGLIERIESGRAAGRPSEVLSNPDPNNCIFMLIDRVETGRFVGSGRRAHPGRNPPAPKLSRQCWPGISDS